MSLTLSEILMDNLPAVVAIFNASGQIRRCNTNFLGYTADEMLQSGILSRVAPESRHAFQRSVIEAFEHGKAETQLWAFSKSGAKIPCYAIGVRIVFENEPCILGIAIDLSKQKQAEEELQKSREEYDVLFENIGDAVFVSRVEEDFTPGHFIRINHAACEYLGYTREELHRLSPRDINDPETATKIFADLAKVPPGEPVLFETKHIAKDGHKIPVEINARVVQLKSGRAGLAIVRDISNRKRSEEALRKSEEQYRLLFESNPIPMWVFDRNTLRFLAVNQSAICKYGYSEPEFLAMTVADIRPKEDVPAFRRRVAKLDSGLQSGGIWRHRKKDGTIIDVEIVSHDFDFRGCNALLVAAHDITEEKRSKELMKSSESKYRMLFENSADAHLLSDDKGILDCNTAALQMFGFSTKSEFLSMGWADLSPEFQTDGTESTLARKQRIADALRSGSGRFEWMHRRKSGELFPAEVSLSAITLDSGLALLGTVRDLTERKRAEDSLKLFRTLMDQSNDAIHVLDRETLRFLDVNEKSCLELGYTREELLSMNVRDVDLNVEDLHSDVEEQLQSAESACIETVHRRKDGSTFPVEVGFREVLLDRVYIVAIARNITERKRTEDALRLFRTLVDHSSDAIHVSDPETLRYLDVNQKACLDLGYTREELLSLSVPAVDANFDETGVQALADLRTKGHALFETLHRRKDGSIFPAEVAVKNVVIDKAYIVSTARDITERKRAEESLKLFRALVEQSDDGVTVSDRDTLRYVDVNERAGASLGYTREEMLSLSLSDVVVDMKDVQKQLAKALQNDGSALFETTVRRKDGSTFPIEVSAREVLLNRRYLLAISRDITERRVMIERLRSSEARLALENRLAEIFLTIQNDQMFSEVLNVVLKELRSDSGLFGVIDEQGALVIPSLRGQIWEACKMQDKSLNFPPELWGGAWGRSLVEKTAVFSNQAGDVPDGHIPILRYMVTPILHGDNPIGILAVANKSTHYDQADQEMLNGIALYLAPVLRARLQRDAEERGRKRAEETILSLARTDPLTGLANRRMLEETLPREAARAQRLHEPLAAIFADLDHFKAINDDFGHQAGDQVLASVGALLKSQVRSYALASRFGGDEFVLILPGTTRDDAVIIAERIREKVAATTVSECPRNFTVSLGVASFVTGESGPGLVARADEALYMAKHNGGNRVEVG